MSAPPHSATGDSPGLDDSFSEIQNTEQAPSSDAVLAASGSSLPANNSNAEHHYPDNIASAHRITVPHDFPNSGSSQGDTVAFNPQTVSNISVEDPASIGTNRRPERAPEHDRRTGPSSMDAGVSTRVSPTTRDSRRLSRVSSPIPKDVEIIDVECLITRTPGIKEEPIEIEDTMQAISPYTLMEGGPSAETSGGPSGESKAEAIDVDGFIKREPNDGEENLFNNPIIVWGNRKEDAIVLDDDEDAVVSHGTGPPLPLNYQQNIHNRALEAPTTPPHQQSSSYMPPRVENGSPEIQHSDPPRNERHVLSPSAMITEVLERPDEVRRASELGDGSVTPAQQHHLVIQGAANASRRENESSNLGKFLGKGPKTTGPSMTAAQQERIRQAQRLAKEKFLAQLHPGTQTAPFARWPADSAGVNIIDEENAAKAAKFAAAKKRYKRKKDSGDLTQTEEIEFMRLEREEQERLDRLDEEAAWELEHGDSLFVGDIGGGSPSKQPCEPDNNDDQDDFDGADDAGEGPLAANRRKPATPWKAGKRAVPLDVEDESFRAGLEEELRPKKKVKTAQNPALGKKTARGKPRGSKAKEAKPKGATKGGKATEKGKGKSRKRPAQPDLIDLPSLFTSDVIRDAQGNENRAAQPTFTDKRKEQALKQLVASVPEEVRKTAQMDKSYLLSASRDFAPRGSVRSNGMGGWIVRGMKSSLKHYQLLGGAFMRRRERGKEEPRGGLCADQMGLGKTVMMLANIINGRPPKAKHPKTTLIVAPRALCNQWFDEINKHCDPKAVGKVLKLYGKTKLATNNDVDAFQDFDIILTTYTEVVQSYPKADPPIELQTPEEKAAWWRVYRKKYQGVLHQIQFLRIVLDEAQAIKNYKSHTSVACRTLMGVHKWALSGTPVQNTLQELYPYFRFLGVPHTGDFRVFKENFCAQDPTKVDRLYSFLSRFMIRRTHLDRLFGAPLVQLPKVTERVHTCKFNDLERNVYEIVRRRMVQRINGFSRKGELERNYSNIFVMLLRLRQLTGHILSVELVMRDLLEREDHEKLQELANAEAKANLMPERKAQILLLRKVLAGNTSDQPHAANQMQTAAGVGLSNSHIGQDDADVGRSHGMRYDFHRYLQSLREGKQYEELVARTMCCKCSEPPENPWVTSCYHIYCQECLSGMQHEASNKGEEHARCLECGDLFYNTRPCDDFTLDASSSSDSAISGSDHDSQHGPKKRKSKGKKKGEDDQIRDWIELEGSHILPSAKTMAIKSQIINWLKENPEVKIIIYTQFITMIRILAKVCAVEKWDYCTYHGGMSFSARDTALQDFANKPEKQILLASLKCGGIGLNLTMASRVICVDPWWNSAVEQQAFCRVFRIGQENETSMTRFIVEKTVDEQLIKMQERKHAEISRIMEDGGDARRKITIPELLKLFGPVEPDEEGKPFIWVDNKDTDLRVGAGSDDEGICE